MLVSWTAAGSAGYQQGGQASALVVPACRSSYATPRILTPYGTPRVAEARVSDTVIWKDSMDSTADSHALPSLSASSQASMEVMHPHRKSAPPRFACVGQTE